MTHTLFRYPTMETKLLCAVAVLLLGVSSSLPASSAAVEVSPKVLKTLEESGIVNIFLHFKASDTARVRNQVKTQTFVNSSSRRKALYEGLKSHSKATQGKVFGELTTGQKQRVQAQNVKQFWITNTMYVKGATREILDHLLGLEELSRIEEEIVVKLEKSVAAPDNSSSPSAGILAGEQWGVKAIGAPEVWNLGFKGAGVVVGHIDSGVRGTHEALRNNHRKEDGWLDPITWMSEPTDDNGHGTHTMGTIVGTTNGIGVAPGAQWIACKACDFQGSCYQEYIESCAEWILCPDFGVCTRAPHLVSNSWGGNIEGHDFDEIIENWVAGDIIPVFAAGNAGPYCRSLGAPSSHEDVISVGSTTRTNTVSSFSSRGPSTLYTGRIQPDVAAPGSEILSASHLSSSQYVTMQGTSMACPHVSGIIALLLSKNPNLTTARIKEVLFQGTKRVTSEGETCGNVRDSVYPNNQVGHGLVHALNSVKILDGQTPDPSPNPEVPPPAPDGVEALSLALKQKEFITFTFAIFYMMKQLVL